MLSHLFISNYALIEKLDINFPRGFITITGETGAGKSVLLGAIGLLMGKRADISALNIYSTKCIIEGMFEIKDYNLKELFQSLDLDYDDQTIIRREISPSGKSRAFLNDTPVALKDLKQIGEKLMDIHGQFSSLQLVDEAGHLAYVDKYANSYPELKSYSQVYSLWCEAKRKLEVIRLEAELSKKEEDYLRFSLNQMNEINLDTIDQVELEEKKRLLENSETIKTTLYSSAHKIVNEEDNIVDSLKQVQRDIAGITSYSSKYQQLNDRIESVIIEADDIGTELDALNDNLIVDPNELDQVQQILDVLYRLQQKFSVDNIDDLIAIKNEMEAKLQRMDSFEIDIHQAEKNIDDAYSEVQRKGSELTKKRTLASTSFAKEISGFLEFVNLKGAEFKVHLNTFEEPRKEGFETASFLFSANKGISATEIGKMASGGEISRLMLAVKAVISKKNTLPTIIFDEIEAGVSGAAAGKIAAVLSDMGKSMQVITITHLPQIASKGICQFMVAKSSEGIKTTSTLKRLSTEERINELAVMLSDGEITSQSMENAKAMLNIP